jgi:arabinogalactan oligomer/maltooligosaccharide transport system substrate-binding protein
MMKNTKWYLLVVVLLLGAFVLVACGGGATETTEEPVATEAAPAPTDEPVVEEPTDVPATEAPAPTDVPVVEETAELMSDTSKSIATLLSENPNFSTLVAAITAAGIEEPAPDAPVTIFAPTNAAFEALPEGMLDELLADPAGDLTKILGYHIVSGAVKAADVTADEDGRVNSSIGEPIDLTALGLVTTDVEGSNGVIHVIDSVLVPPTIANAALAEQLAAEGTPVIRIWADTARTEALQTVETNFEEEYGVELLIEEVDFGTIRSNFLIAGPAGEGPDVIIGVHDWLGEFVANGLLAPIDAGDLTDSFSASSIDAFTYDGELYGLPYSTENVAFFINTDLVPECPATWEEVYQISADLHAADPEQYGFVRMEGDPYHFYPIQTAFGGYVFARDEEGNYDPTQVGVGDPGSIAAAQWWERQVTEGLQPPAVDWNIQHEMFENGTSAMQITGPWKYQDTVDSGIPFAICPIPTGTVEGKPFMGANGFMVSAFAKDPVLAQIFLTEFVATEEVQQALFDNGERPSAYLPVLEASDQEWMADFNAAGQNADPMPEIPEMSAVWEAWGNAVVLIAQGADTAENAFTTAQQQIINTIEGN